MILYSNEPKTEAEINKYYSGMREGLRLYAWWKDSEQYVGTCGTKLKEAISEVFVQEAKELERYRIING